MGHGTWGLGVVVCLALPTAAKAQVAPVGVPGGAVRLEADGSMRGVYPRDDGALVGRVEHGVLTGWWCEAPTRRPDRDAGDVELVFERDGDRLILRGAWRDGATAEAWHRGWDLERTETPVDFALLAALDDEQRFCQPPD